MFESALNLNADSYTLCKECGVNFCLFSIHQRLFHSDKREVKCAFCGSPFLSQDALLRHIEQHSDSSDFFCCVCFRRFVSDESLTEHLESHRELHVYFCSKCRGTFASKAVWGAHDCVDGFRGKMKKEEYFGGDEGEVSVACDVLKTSEPLVSKEGLEMSSHVTVQRGPVVQIRKRKLRMSSCTFSESSNSIQDDSLTSELPSKCLKVESPKPAVESSQPVSMNPSQTTKTEPNDNTQPTPSISEEKQEVIDQDELKVKIVNTTDSKAACDVSNNTLSFGTVFCVDRENEVDNRVIKSDLDETNLQEMPVALPDTPPLSAEDCNEGADNSLSSSSELVSSEVEPEVTVDKKVEPGHLTYTYNKQEEPEQLNVETEKVLKVRRKQSKRKSERGVAHGSTAFQRRQSRFPLNCDQSNSSNALGSLEPSLSLAHLGSEEPANLENAVEPTPPASPDLKKKRTKIKFNEKIEFWNPLLGERIWLAITEESPVTREVPLLEPPLTKKMKKKASQTKKNKPPPKRARKRNVKGDKQKTSEMKSPLKLHSSPKSSRRPSLLAPHDSHNPNLESSVDQILKMQREQIERRPRKKMVLTKSRLRNKTTLFAKYGDDFHYDKCVKGDGRYHCPEVECHNHRGYADVRGLRNHIRVQHVVAPCFTCHKCGITFAVSCKLKAHMVVHSDANSYSCDICGDQFKTKATMNNHRSVHSQPWQCYHCNRRFSIKQSLKAHLRETYCKCCNLSFRCAEMFINHETEVSHIYGCMLCSLEMSTKRNFSWHMATVHYSETTKLDGSYKCEVCDRKFSCRKNALRHVRKTHAKLKLSS